MVAASATPRFPRTRPPLGEPSVADDQTALSVCSLGLKLSLRASIEPLVHDRPEAPPCLRLVSRLPPNTCLGSRQVAAATRGSGSDHRGIDGLSACRSIGSERLHQRHRATTQFPLRNGVLKPASLSKRSDDRTWDVRLSLDRCSEYHDRNQRAHRSYPVGPCAFGVHQAGGCSSSVLTETPTLVM